MMTAMTRSILLIIGGGIAAYKSLELIRTLKKRGIGVTAIMTKSAGEFVTPLWVLPTILPPPPFSPPTSRCWRHPP